MASARHPGHQQCFWFLAPLMEHIEFGEGRSGFCRTGALFMGPDQQQLVRKIVQFTS